MAWRLTTEQIFEAFNKILTTVQKEMAGETESVQYAEYRRRCVVWKRKNNIPLNEKDEMYAKQVDNAGE